MKTLNLTDALHRYAEKKYISFHTPGHKGKLELPASVLDVTELEETDNLFSPNGVLLQSQQELADSIGCKHMIYLPNGATSGNLGVLYSLFREGDKVLVDRNCHISVLHGLILSGIMPVFTECCFHNQLPLPPNAENVRNILRDTPGIKGVYITSPNYYGMLADVKAISALADEYQIPLIVDEAHGAHLYYTENGANGALNQGAHVCILSLHKTLTAPTQCGAVIYNNKRFDIAKQGVKYFTSTSPSYLLMSGMEQVAAYMAGSGTENLHKITKYVTELREKIKEISYLELVETERYDPTRIVISIARCRATMEEFAAYLKKKHRLVCEMTDPMHIVFVVTLCNTIEELESLYEGLKDAAGYFGAQSYKEQPIASFSSKMIVTPKEARFAEQEEVSISCANGRVAGETIICFPPSVPLTIPGEEICERTIARIRQYTEKNTVWVLK